MKEIKDIPIASLKRIGLFDIPILHHGFEDHKRDYFFIVESGTKEHTGRFKLLFTHCFDLTYRHKFADPASPDLLRRSWDDSLTKPEGIGKENAYWWGQGFTIAYPGFSYDPDSAKAKEMTEICQRPMYAIKLETEHYEINFIFHDFRFEHLSNDHPISDGVFIKPGPNVFIHKLFNKNR
ncbi:MAG: hypothetical protein IPI07_14320 [Flavobacteriales bacterium]|nr:hypothetical protein [Flavobacteriales bacterium]MBK9075710.1 hypothetical protein [Flavobacteriales bacterium]